MLDMLRKRQENEEGFTLIELMVVVLIIAILLAIAIPTFLGARDRANDRAAQSSLRNALTAAKVIFTDKQDYSAATASAVGAEEPNLTFGATSATANEIAVQTTPAATTWFAAAKSKAGKCFFIKDVSSATGGGTTYLKAAAGATCSVDTTSTAYSKTGWE